MCAEPIRITYGRRRVIVFLHFRDVSVLAHFFRCCCKLLLETGAAEDRSGRGGGGFHFPDLPEILTIYRDIFQLILCFVFYLIQNRYG